MGVKDGNFKVKCIKESNCFESGEIYIVEDGSIINDGYYFGENLKSVEDINDWFDAKFELVEEQTTKQFKPQDIKPCMVVKVRNGKLLIAMQSDKSICLYSSLNYLDFECRLEEYNNMFEFSSHVGDRSFDMVKIYGYSKFNARCFEISTDNRELLWSRKEQPVKLTKDQIREKFGVEDFEIVD